MDPRRILSGAALTAIIGCVLAGCGPTKSGTPVAATSSSTSATAQSTPVVTTTTPAPASYPTTAPYHRGEPLRGLLLGLDEMHRFLGGRLEYTTDSDQPLDATTDRPECGGVLNAATAQVLSDSGYRAMHVQVITDTRGSAEDTVQFAIEFPDTESARNFLVTQTGKWKSCVGQELSLTYAGHVSRWQVVSVNDANLAGGMVMPASKELRPGPNGEPPDPYDTSLYCGQTVSQVSNYVVGAAGCSGGDQGIFGSLLRSRVPVQ